MGDLKAKARLKGLMGPHDGVGALEGDCEVGDIVSDAAEAGLVQGIQLSEPEYMHALANDELKDLLGAELGLKTRKRAMVEYEFWIYK